MEQPTQQQLPKRVSLPTETINEILSVFSQMPYREVANIIQKVQQEVTPIPDESSPVKADPKVIQMDPEMSKK